MLLRVKLLNSRAIGSTGGYQAKPRQMEGVSCGHAFNGAMNYILAHGLTNSNEFIVETAKKVHNITERVKAEYAKANPYMSAYDSGAAAGNSVLNACKLLDKVRLRILKQICIILLWTF